MVEFPEWPFYKSLPTDDSQPLLLCDREIVTVWRMWRERKPLAEIAQTLSVSVATVRKVLGVPDGS